MTPFIHYAHTSGKLRLYASPDGYKNRAEYDAITEALWITQTTIQLQCAKGDLNRRAILAVFAKCYSLGAERIIIQRAKGRKMPWGTVIESDEHEDTYLINLLELRHRGVIDG